MSKKTLPHAGHAAACSEQPKPWQRRGRRGISITIIVIELLRIEAETVAWQDPLESGLAPAVALLGVELVCGTVRRVARLLAQLLPERIEFTRPNGRPRFSFGW
ncbi:hypothetical protein ACFC0D_19125 [Streptomyces sp. NPDC056222]|uniref:hypothetical protein n=1 Tax=Streptomyces sp. NPDC056222 TaxID=3345749 RepID=UPI0035E09221